jgi:flagellar basal-body rod protein FlgB
LDVELTVFGTSLATPQGARKEHAVMEIFPKTLAIVEKAMDARMANQRLVASNLANIDTPGYQAQRLDFEATMQNVLEEVQAASDTSEVGPLKPVIYASDAPSRSMDGNNVDVDEEMGELTTNKLVYTLSSKMIADKFTQMNLVVQS